MSSREIAELVEKRHDSVKRTVERLVERGVIEVLPVVEDQIETSHGRKHTATTYHLGQRDTYIVVAQLSPEFTARVVDRWQELEGHAPPHPVAMLNDPDMVPLIAEQVLAERKMRAGIARQARSASHSGEHGAWQGREGRAVKSPAARVATALARRRGDLLPVGDDDALRLGGYPDLDAPLTCPRSVWPTLRECAPPERRFRHGGPL
ncbi:hypothetical protein CCR87_09355 [Rhodobaculum claviforme]|uniref:Phage regulatory protein Rha (Phage_pRha) n=2 Tax=Rhodobaculum claviforme TaxID=1549854 RepID=A0A934TK06_9RHOB|nr:hypothetical protein [Rhodobaculum claviforme]